MVKSNSWINEKNSRSIATFFKIAAAIFLLFTAYFLVRYAYARLTIVSRTMQATKAIADQRKNEIIAFLQDQRTKSAQIASNAQVVKSFIALRALFNPQQETAEYKNEENNLDQFFHSYKARYYFRDVIFIGADGALFYTTKIDVFGEKNIFKGDYAASAVAKSFERVRMTLTPDITEFAISILAKEPALYILQPVFDNQKFIGAVAIWIDEAALYKIIQNYQGLGKSGDIFALKAIEDRALFVAPARNYANVAFKKITSPDPYAVTPGRKAALGLEGSGKIVDTFGTSIVGSWVYVPQLDVGLTVAIPMVELLQPIKAFLSYGLIALVFFVVCLLAYLFFIRRLPFMRSLRAQFFTVRTCAMGLWIITIALFILSVFLVFNYYYQYQKKLNQALQEARLTINSEGILINQYLKEVSSIAQMIAKDLQTGALKKEDIGLRIKKDVKELKEISRITVAFAPFAYDPQERLYEITAYRENQSVSVTTPNDDYMIPAPDEEPQAGWYDRVIKKNQPLWSTPFIDPVTKKETLIYAVPFYSGTSAEPVGVIAIEYQLDKIIQRVRGIQVGKTGYGIILSDQNKFIYHPVEQLVKEKLGLQELSQEKENKDFKLIAEQILSGKSGSGSFYDRASRLQNWILFEPISQTKWSIATLFNATALDLPLNHMHKQRIWIFIVIVLTLLFCTMLISHIYRLTRENLRLWAILTSILFAGAIIFFWIFLHRTPYEPRADITVVRDQANVDKFVEFLDYDTVQRNEKRPIVIPTGIILNTLSFSGSNKVSISGYIWQKIKSDVKIVEGIRFPEATDATFKEVMRKKNGPNEELIGWNFQANFLQKHRYSWFPFDRVHVDLTIASADFEHNILLVPDFSNYQSLEIDPLPGIANQISIPGFTLERSFFSFSAIASYNEVGLESVKDVTENVQLHYNVILTRNLTNPLIIFFLPLLIILFTIFAVFLLSYKGHFKTDSFKSLSSYTAVFFSLVILHQTLRGQYQAGELFYIEYFFFFTYISMLILILHALLIRVSRFRFFIDRKISPYLSILFWPVQFALWFTVTMLVFYVIR